MSNDFEPPFKCAYSSCCERGVIDVLGKGDVCCACHQPCTRLYEINGELYSEEDALKMEKGGITSQIQTGEESGLTPEQRKAFGGLLELPKPKHIPPPPNKYVMPGFHIRLPFYTPQQPMSNTEKRPDFNEIMQAMFQGKELNVQDVKNLVGRIYNALGKEIESLQKRVDELEKKK